MIHTDYQWYTCMGIPLTHHLLMSKPLVMVLQSGWSPLMIASDKGHLDVVKTLIEAGVNVNHTNKVGVYHVHCTLLLP